jgi:ketosteroid isomerase-like protein
MNIDIEAVRSAEQELAAAHVRLDLDLINRLLHPDYVIVQPGGRVEHKAQVLESYRSGARHWDSAASDEMDVRIYADTAIVVGRWRAQGRNGDFHFDYAARFLSVWIRENGRWLNLTSQSTEIEA